MGVLDRIFGGSTTQHPALDPASPVAVRLTPFTNQLEKIAGATRDGIEAVPQRDSLFVFVGHPPKAFGVVRYRAQGEDNLIQLMREAKLSMVQVQEISDQARSAYVEHQGAPRFTHQVGRRAIIVIDCEPLGPRLEAVFDAARG
jgi:hypothetical protein